MLNEIKSVLNSQINIYILKIDVFVIAYVIVYML